MLDEKHLRRWQFWRKPPQRLDLTGILWPALGFPAVVEAAAGGEARFEVLLCLPGCAAPEPSQFRARLCSDGETRLRNMLTLATPPSNVF